MKKIPALDGLRAISILAVLATHMLPVGPKVLRLNETTGPMGMSLFFALSGFLITSNLWTAGDVRSFFVRRLTRILPLAYAYLALVYLVVEYNPRNLFASLVFIENYAHSYIDSLNSHFWSLCVEMHFYIAIGLAFALFGKRGLWIVLPACVAITTLRVVCHSYINIMTHLRADEIMAGASVALLYHNGLLRFRASTWWLVAAATMWFISSSPFSGPLQYIRPYMSAAVLACTIGLGPCFLLSVLSGRLARYIAGISYALYVFHPLTIYGWMNEGTVFERYALKRPISFAATFLLAHISTFYWESKWIAWGKKATRPTNSVSSLSPFKMEKP